MRSKRRPILTETGVLVAKVLMVILVVGLVMVSIITWSCV